MYYGWGLRVVLGSHISKLTLRQSANRSAFKFVRVNFTKEKIVTKNALAFVCPRFSPNLIKMLIFIDNWRQGNYEQTFKCQKHQVIIHACQKCELCCRVPALVGRVSRLGKPTGMTEVGRKTLRNKTDSIKFKISSKTSRGKKDSTKRHHHRHHKRQPGEQQFPKRVVTG